LKEHDKYKTAFIIPFGQWNVMPMGLKNAPAESQNIMNNILSPCNEFTVVYLN